MQTVEVLIIQYPLALYFFLPLKFKYVPQHPVLKYPQFLFVLPSACDQVPHPHKKQATLKSYLLSNICYTRAQKCEGQVWLRNQMVASIPLNYSAHNFSIIEF